MRPAHFLLLFTVCVVWGLNFVVTKWIVAGDGTLSGYQGMPPLFAVAVRFALAAVVLAPLLRPIPRDFAAVIGVALVFGAAHFGFIHLGMVTATPSAAAITIQLVVPFTAILSVLLLGERIGAPRAVGIALAFLGVVLIAFDPSQAAVSIGILFIACGAACGAWGAILVKQLKPIDALRLQAWIVVISTPILFLMSVVFESGQIAGLTSGGWGLAAAMVFVVGAVTIFGHTAYVWLLRRYEASFVSPLTLMAPLWGVVFGVLLMGDPITLGFVAGAAVALTGVGVVAVRTGRRASVMAGPPQTDLQRGREEPDA